MNIKVTTLAPVHIGSGTLLQYNSDFFTVTVAKSGNSFVRVIDPRKILELIGEEHLQDWLLAIERKQNIKEFMKVYAPDAKPVDYSSRKMYLSLGSFKEGDTLKECIHNGLGLPYIPGSSIKGAIRTAVTATLAKRTSGLEEKIRNKKNNFEGKVLESKLFGADANQDIFRFLQCGDVYFRGGCEIVFRLQMYLNITQKDSLVEKDDIKPQMVEAIGVDETAECLMKLNTDYYQWIKGKQPGSVGTLPPEMENMSSLFKLVNEHTLGLVEQEIAFWSKQEKSGAESYVKEMEQLAETIKTSIAERGKSCILRVGHASGWDFITGGWARELPNFECDIVPASRPNDKVYSQYAFPKSRRLDSNGEYIGFVRLEMA